MIMIDDNDDNDDNIPEKIGFLDSKQRTVMDSKDVLVISNIASSSDFNPWWLMKTSSNEYCKKDNLYRLPLILSASVLLRSVAFCGALIFTKPSSSQVMSPYLFDVAQIIGLLWIM